MTEAEWLACAQPHAMLDELPETRQNDRKMRLFACACVRRVWHALRELGPEREAVEIAERFAEGLATRKEMQAINRKLWQSQGAEAPYALVAWELTARPRSN